MNRQELKARSWAQVKSKIGMLFLVSIIIALISTAASFVLNFIPVVGTVIATFIVLPAFTLSTMRLFLNVIAGGEPEAKDAFYGFEDFWAAVKVNFFVSLYTFLWSLLFVIPGIVKCFSYSMAWYILAENKGKSAHECIEESKRMTNGHKMELFVLGLSFIGWILLGYVTCGIAYIWVYPYIQATFANAYQSLKPIEL